MNTTDLEDRVGGRFLPTAKDFVFWRDATLRFLEAVAECLGEQAGPVDVLRHAAMQPSDFDNWLSMVHSTNPGRVWLEEAWYPAPRGQTMLSDSGRGSIRNAARMALESATNQGGTVPADSKQL